MPNLELRERELIKVAALASAIADALHQRGVSDPAASLAAEAGIAALQNRVRMLPVVRDGTWALMHRFDLGTALRPQPDYRIGPEAE